MNPRAEAKHNLMTGVVRKLAAARNLSPQKLCSFRVFSSISTFFFQSPKSESLCWLRGCFIWGFRFSLLFGSLLARASIARVYPFDSLIHHTSPHQSDSLRQVKLYGNFFRGFMDASDIIPKPTEKQNVGEKSIGVVRATRDCPLASESSFVLAKLIFEGQRPFVKPFCDQQVEPRTREVIDIVVSLKVLAIRR